MATPTRRIPKTGMGMASTVVVMKLTERREKQRCGTSNYPTDGAGSIQKSESEPEIIRRGWTGDSPL
ncbi:MAG: hypothetical protein AAF600_18815 [Bacteroidota bacterium]